MKNKQQLQKWSLAAVLTALSIAIDIFFKTLVASSTFGLPFYAIPLVLASIILGPLYGAVMALAGDFIGVTISGYGWLPLFMIAPLFWGIVPGLFMRRRYSRFRLAYVIPLSYLFATTANTIAILVHFDRIAALSTLALRLSLVLFNSIIMFYLVQVLYERLLPLHQHLSLQPRLSKDT